MSINDDQSWRLQLHLDGWTVCSSEHDLASLHGEKPKSLSSARGGWAAAVVAAMDDEMMCHWIGWREHLNRKLAGFSQSFLGFL